jgi:hypothetical protein
MKSSGNVGFFFPLLDEAPAVWSTPTTDAQESLKPLSVKLYVGKNKWRKLT